LFLETVLARNPGLIETAVTLHRESVIPPNSYVIDLDAVVENARRLRAAADQNGMRLYFTTKQIGFNPRVAEYVSKAAIDQAIAIDFQEAVALSQNHIPIGHMGHLVQLASQQIARALELGPEVMTVFSAAKARQISQAAERLGKEVRLLLRVVSDQDYLYHGQEGGIAAERLVAEAAEIQKLPNVRIVGVTSFPCLQLDEVTRDLKPTQNLYTILRAAETLHQKLGVEIEQINAPGNTCVGSIPLLARMGATHGEPGHALTGTSYLHAQRPEPEKPALVYASEVSHLDEKRICVFGGGAPRRARIYSALVGSSPECMVKTSVMAIDPASIDYYISLDTPESPAVSIGDTTIMAGRAQIFISRAYVAVVSGIQTGKPSLLGIYDAWGRPAENSCAAL
jgi:predicted amino acid racemase